jgi:hypothetical protein
MSDIDNLEHRYTVTFPPAAAFAVDDVLNLLACAVQHGIHSNRPELPRPFLGKWGQAASDIEADTEDETDLNVDLEEPTKTTSQPSESRWPNHETPEDIKKEIIDYKAYLSGRLLKAVKQGKFELRNSTLDKVVEPPGSDDAQADHNRNYQTLFWWARLTSILKEDLISFCSAEKIGILFEGDAPHVEDDVLHMEDDAPHVHISPSESPPESVPPASEIPKDEVINACAEISEPVPGSYAPQQMEILASKILKNVDKNVCAETPGPLPKLYVAQLAVEIAWQIECETGRIPRPRTVMELLKKLAGSDKYTYLTATTLDGVWAKESFNSDAAKWDLDACRKALTRWREKRGTINEPQ